MSLVANIHPGDAYAGQLVEFRVLKPVIHEGETIIEAGAPAEGHITQMNNRKMTLVFTTVTAVNGQKIRFHEDELDGKPEKVLSRKHFTAIIRKGLSLVL
jgi:hypothetical protein